MSGTSLILLAMYSTVNVVGPAGSAMSPGEFPIMLGLLMAAGTLTCAGMVALNVTPTRHIPKGPTLPRAKRRLTGPGERRR